MKRFQSKAPMETKEKLQLANSLNISEKKIVEWFRYKQIKERDEERFGEGE